MTDFVPIPYGHRGGVCWPRPTQGQLSTHLSSAKPAREPTGFSRWQARQIKLTAPHARRRFLATNTARPPIHNPSITAPCLYRASREADSIAPLCATTCRSSRSTIVR